MTTTSIHWLPPFPATTLLVGLALAALAYLILRWISGAPIATSRRLGPWMLRALILAVVAVIVFNPVRIARTPGAIERPTVAYLLDASRSMALGSASGTRWDEATATLRDAGRPRTPNAGPQIHAFRFGSRLSAIESSTPGATDAPPPTDTDSLLAGALEDLAGRFGETPPHAVVAFSDGRAQDAEQAEAIARGYQRMGVPIHVVPVGETRAGGDAAIVSLTVPSPVRKSSQVSAQVFLRSHGYEGRHAELRLAARGPDGRPGPALARTPVTLQDGLADYRLTFPSGEQDVTLVATLDPQPGEVSTANNSATADLAIDHTRVRVLYLEGSPDRQGLPVLAASPGAYTPSTSIERALTEDPDLDCMTYTPADSGGTFLTLDRPGERSRPLPATSPEWFAFDAIFLGNLPREALTDQQIAWVEEWVARRGGGLAMLGGPRSFGSGRWGDSAVGKMLPVDLAAGADDWKDGPTTLRPVVEGPLHPIWHLTPDDAQNRALLKALPAFGGSNRVGPAKPTADILAWTVGNGDAREPALAVQPFGRGRTLTLSPAIGRRWAADFAQSWGGPDARASRKFWRNVAYWLTANSAIGRRRLLASPDRTLNRPGEPIVLRAQAFDEDGGPTTAYRLAVSVEPASAADASAEVSPLRRPSAQAPDAPPAPLLPWGEELDLARVDDNHAYRSTFPIATADAFPTGTPPSLGLRIEVTAYDGSTQIDSTSLSVQILDDPIEQRNPLPDHDLLRRIAVASGGKVLRGPVELARVLSDLPISVGPTQVDQTPVWSRAWLLVVLLTLLAVEWAWRRRLGLS